MQPSPGMVPRGADGKPEPSALVSYRHFHRYSLILSLPAKALDAMQYECPDQTYISKVSVETNEA